MSGGDTQKCSETPVPNDGQQRKFVLNGLAMLKITKRNYRSVQVLVPIVSEEVKHLYFKLQDGYPPLTTLSLYMLSTWERTILNNDNNVMIMIFTETGFFNMKTNILQHLLIALVTFAPLRPALCITLAQRYPYWSYYLTTPNVTRLDFIMEVPIEVWPAGLFENYTKLKVCRVMRETKPWRPWKTFHTQRPPGFPLMQHFTNFGVF